MRVINASFYYDNFIKTEEELLQRYFTTVGWAEALQRKGVETIVMQRFTRDSYVKRNNVQYYFIKDGFTGSLKPWQLPYKFLKRIADYNADIVHLHTFPGSLPAFLLRFLLNRKTGIVIQNHGGKVTKGIIELLHKSMSHVADAFFFTDTEQGKHWFKNKNLLKKIMPVMEGSPVFNFKISDRDQTQVYTDRKETRLQLYIQGNPVFLWVGRLDENKDPLTILTGLEVIFESYTNASLYMIYSDDKLLTGIQEKIDNSQSLRTKVHLLGQKPHNLMENYYKSADYFVLGSHYEGSGFALSEALSCGCIPIVTDIPSFRMMTDKGKLGALWKAGDVNEFINAVQKAIQKPLKEEADNCVTFFNKNLSSDAIANITVRHYQKIIASRNK